MFKGDVKEEEVANDLSKQSQHHFDFEQERFVRTKSNRETRKEFMARQYRNVVHFIFEDWFLSAALGIITACLSLFVDVSVETMRHYKIHLYDMAVENGGGYSGFAAWVLYLVGTMCISAFICQAISKQAAGSGIPEIKVVMQGFPLKGYQGFRTVVAKVFSLIFAMGGGFVVGKEGPFVHIGSCIATLLNKASIKCNLNHFFSNEGRIYEMLTAGCAVGISCTFACPIGAVLYGIESTSKYFSIKNYSRCFFATVCSAFVFRFAINLIFPPAVAGTINAYYPTSFPNDIYVAEELPFFVFIGVCMGLLAAAFTWFHGQCFVFCKQNRALKAVFAKSPIAFTALMAILIGVVTYPGGFGIMCAGKISFRQALGDFISNCSFILTNTTKNPCPTAKVLEWNSGYDEDPYFIFYVLVGYCLSYFFLVSACSATFVPTGIFVPSLVIGGSLGRLFGELVALWFPDGMRGADHIQIYPGLYAIVAATAFTGAVTHSLSVALIMCETTGQLVSVLPILLALMIANAICSFIQPSIYETMIKIKKYPYLADLPPSRISVHTMKVDHIMVNEIVVISRDTTYSELRAILTEYPNFKSYPLVVDKESMILLGSVSRKYLVHLMVAKLGLDPALVKRREKNLTPSEILSNFNNIRRNSSTLNAISRTMNNRNNTQSTQLSALTGRSVSGNTLLATSPLHENITGGGPLAPLLSQQPSSVSVEAMNTFERVAILNSVIELDDIAIDPAPFQLVCGTSLYKVHMLFSLLALNHAYVTDKGRLVGVLHLKELRTALADIYSKGAVAPERKNTLEVRVDAPLLDDGSRSSEDGMIVINSPKKKDEI